MPRPLPTFDASEARPRHAAARVLLAAAWLLAFAGLRPLALPDEGRYPGVAWEMLGSGHWLVPTIDGLPYFHKPPLFYWITAAAMQWLGPVPIAARIAPWLGSVLAMVSLHRLLRVHAAPAAAGWSVALLATMPLFFLAAQFANMDMLAAGCITAATTLLADAALRAPADAAGRRSRLAAHAAMALGVLAKGLIGVALPVLVMLVWLGARRRWRDLAALFAGPGVAIFAALALPWFVAVEARHPGFLDYFIVEQHVRRFATGGFNNLQPAWFYPALLLLTAAPALLALGPRHVARRDGSPIDGLLLAWLGVVLVFFSIPASKPVGYIVPALPPLAALIGRHLAAAAWRPRAALCVAVLACLGAEGWALWMSTQRSTQALATPLELLRHDDEPWVLVDAYPFDLALLAHTHGRPVVVADWDEVARTRHDDWQHELHDAARFAPALATRRLLARADLAAWLCRAGTSWVVAPRADAALKGTPLATTRDLGLWRVDATGLDACRGSLPANRYPSRCQPGSEGPTCP